MCKTGPKLLASPQELVLSAAGRAQRRDHHSKSECKTMWEAAKVAGNAPQVWKWL